MNHIWNGFLKYHCHRLRFNSFEISEKNLINSFDWILITHFLNGKMLTNYVVTCLFKLWQGSKLTARANFPNDPTPPPVLGPNPNGSGPTRGEMIECDEYGNRYFCLHPGFTMKTRWVSNDNPWHYWQTSLLYLPRIWV